MSGGSPKLVLIGSNAVGKTSIIRRYTTNAYSAAYNPTIGGDFVRHRGTFRGSPFDLAIWDTSGSRSFRSLTPSYCRNADMALVVFSLSDADSFVDVPDWIECVRSGCPSVLIVLCGNKLDLLDRRSITFEHAIARAQEHKIKYIEISAKTGQGVHDAFDMLIQDYAERTTAKAVTGALPIDGQDPAAKSGCC